MIRTLFLNPHQVKLGSVVKTLDQTPSPQKYDYFKILKKLSYSSKDQVGEFKVKPIHRSVDPDNLKGWYR